MSDLVERLGRGWCQVLKFEFVWNILGIIFNIQDLTPLLLSFQLLQRLDYRPGKSDLFRAINLANIDFDVILMMFILVVALVFLFYLQFGVYGIGL